MPIIPHRRAKVKPQASGRWPPQESPPPRAGAVAARRMAAARRAVRRLAGAGLTAERGEALILDLVS